jgi:ribosomal protein S18 acetylase RimI-like enzyme
MVRTFQGEADRRRMRDLVRLRAADHVHTVDLPYRLSSWALDEAENVGMWEDKAGCLMAWAALQTPFWTIDIACHPEAPTDLWQHALRWADERATAVLATPYGHPVWFVNVFRHQEARRQELEAQGFACQEHVGENSWSKALLQYAEPEEPEAPDLPPGFLIRASHGVAEVAEAVRVHRAAFGSENMTEGWRRRFIERPEYAADRDLVMVAPDGQLVGFCVCWFDAVGPTGLPSGQIEPMGVLPEFHRHGLGRALLTEGIRRLRQHGAEAVFVESDRDRDGAFDFYHAVGFRVLHDVLVFRKDYVR